MKRLMRFIGVPVVLIISGAASIAQKTTEAQVASLLKRDSLTVLITDSGLGGLSVCAELESQLRLSSPVRAAKLIFVNALPDLDYTYNSMATVEEQVRVFDSALRGMRATCRPDVILIACNTLSAVYPKTRFAHTEAIPVVSIIDVGSELIASRSKKHSNSRILILGTPSTVNSGIYQEKLSAMGLKRSEIIAQPCKLLESEIQSDPQSDLVGSLIETYIDEAMEKLGAGFSGRLSVGLCCSHYGYSIEAFRQALSQRVGDRFELLNPNDVMVALFKVPGTGASRGSNTHVEVLSRVPFTEQEIQSIAGALGNRSPATATALRHYTLMKDLFQVSK